MRAAREFSRIVRTTDATQISSAITQNTRTALVNARLPPFLPSSLLPASLPVSLGKSKRPAHRGPYELYTKWRAHRKDYPTPRARFGCRGPASIEFVYGADHWGYKSKSWTELHRKMRIAREDGTHIVRR